MNLPYKRAPHLVRPFIYLRISIGEEAFRMLLLLCVQIALLFMSKSFSALTVIASAASASFAADIVVSRFFRRRDEEHFTSLASLVQGIIIGMLLPETYPPLSAFTASLASMFVVKYFFGGFSYAWVNPAAFTAVMLWFTGARLFPELIVTRELLASKNPSELLLSAGVFPIHSFDSALTAFFNNALFAPFKVSVPEGYVSLFWDNGSAIPAFRFNFALLVSSAVIYGRDAVKAVIPAFFLLTYLLLVRAASPFFYKGIPLQGDMLLALLTGGTLFTSVFVLGWYGTIPCSIGGRILYGVFGGLAAFFIAGAGSSSSGMIFAVVLTNIFSVFVQKWEEAVDLYALKKTLSEARGCAGS
ncbi:MAG: RnfABCDGE type electron transport complex subunit D [Treponema sp.]